MRGTRHSRRGSAVQAGLVALVLAGCATGGDAGQGAPPAAGTDPPPATPTPATPTPADPTEPTVTLTPEPDRSAGPPPPVGSTTQDAVADLADRLGLGPEEVTVVRDVAVTWRDGSLGCPAPGMAYTQALTPGRLVVLEAAGRTVEYHAGGGRGLFLCENPEPPAEAETDR